MKATLTLENGKTIEMELTEEQSKLINQHTKKRTGYERAKYYNAYYSSDNSGFINNNIIVNEDVDVKDWVANSRYESADYYNDETLAKNITRADALMRKLRRFAVENGGSFSKEEWEWKDDYIEMYKITYNYLNKTFNVMHSYAGNKHAFSVYFRSEEIAKKAIDTFKEDLLWYFTEYDDMLR